jgi:single-strand DNA-binding protein
MNTIQLIGRPTIDPELRYTPTGMATTTLRMAVPRRKRNGEDQPPVYVDVVTYGAQAEAVAKYVTKGRRVAVTGRTVPSKPPTEGWR